ncbi:hypothetical protein [Pseudogemmobacter humi]|uniref:Uncharacterized protein n=1 Tax=Pseudogemmobacter humi TaxID=2483812 RepID=A0A3P5XRZ8_9RHOB|nr:hypothetical protein [Pseudogemmobacter humi]VDC31762.1 hypothetical protein XINFAN_03117 [Pseudogemmobacter humi]
MRRLACLAALIAAPAAAEVACPMEHAVYSDAATGFHLRFRPTEPWESVGMVMAVFDADLADGRRLWGDVASNMGTSRDIGRLYDGCPRPGQDDATDDEVLEGCRVWEGVVYGLDSGLLMEGLPGPDQPAPQSLILADLGRQLRYAVFSSPGEEPWDQLFLTGCGAE